MKLRKFIAISLAVFAALYALAYMHGCAPLTPADKQAIAADGVRIAVCESYGRECKRTGGKDCFDIYDSCILDAGLREGSAR